MIGNIVSGPSYQMALNMLLKIWSNDHVYTIIKLKPLGNMEIWLLIRLKKFTKGFPKFGLSRSTARQIVYKWEQFDTIVNSNHDHTKHKGYNKLGDLKEPSPSFPHRV